MADHPAPRQTTALPRGRPRQALAGAAAATAMTAAWAAAAYLAASQLEFLAVLAGVAAGRAVAGPGSYREPRLQAAGAALAVAACAAGTLAAMTAVLAAGHGPGPAAVFSRPASLLRAYEAATGWAGLLFWAVAAAGGAFPPGGRARRRRARAGAGPRRGEGVTAARPGPAPALVLDRDPGDGPGSSRP